jgi:hypothetical protein
MAVQEAVSPLIDKCVNCLFEFSDSLLSKFGAQVMQYFGEVITPPLILFS